MHIINTVNKNGLARIRGCLLFAICVLSIGIFTGCTKGADDLNKAEKYESEATAYYQKALDLYKGLIAKGGGTDELHFKIGKLYYEHGDFKEAVPEFKNAQDPRARKYLGISYYRLGNFTDAREVFDKDKLLDGEGQYYFGLTCEKLNLFDQAMSIYVKIKAGEYAALAKERLDSIEKQAGHANIKETDPEIYRIIASSPSEKGYPQAGALVLLADEKMEVTPDYAQISSMHYIVKIINERGKDEFSETHIDYDSTFEKVELEFARVIKPDGSVTDVGTRHIRDVSKYLNFPLYSNARVFIISFPEITEGAVIEYKVKVYRNELINKKDFAFVYSLQSTQPVIKALFSVKIPQKIKLYLKNINTQYNNFSANPTPATKQDSGSMFYEWQYNNIPQIVPESNMPPADEINPSIIISTFQDWKDVYEWWWNLAREKIKPDAEIKNKVRDLIKGINSEEDRIRAIYNFCAQKIRYVAVEYGQAGYEPHAAEDIFKNKYGDCKDKAVLLVTMLKEAGFEAGPVLISTKDNYNMFAEFPAILFNHAIAAINLKGRIVFMDATAETCSFGDLPAGDQQRTVLFFAPKDYQILETPLFAAEHNLLKQELRVKVNDDESVSCDKVISTKGIYDQAQRYWLLYTPPELIEETLREKIQDVSIASKLEGYEIKNADNLNKPVMLEYTFKGPEYFTLAGNLRIMPQLANFDVSLVAKEKRKYPIDFGVLDCKETILEVALPGNFVVKYIPQNITEESPWMKFVASYSQRGNSIYFMQKTEVKKKTVMQQEYPEFKTFFDSLAKKIKQHIILEKVNK